MIEFGKTLRLAREEKGYSISQLAEMTRMIHQTIEDLENENFTKIAAPIYGRGFVKLYCEAVGLDPKPMVAEFMEIFNGNRELGIKERPVSPPQADDPLPRNDSIAERTPPPSIPEPIASEPPPLPPKTNTFQPELEPCENAPLPEPIQPQQQAEPVLSETKPRLSRYASPLREAKLPSMPTISPTVWRMAALGIGALVVLWLLALGFKALYRATSGAESPAGAAQQAESPAPDTYSTEKARKDAGKDAAIAATSSAAKRETVEIPPLYVD